MHNHRQCPIPTRGGRDCWETPHPDSRHGLCERHWRALSEERFAGSDHLGLRCKACGQFGLRTIPGDHVAYCVNRDCATVEYDVDLTIGEDNRISLNYRLREEATPRPIKAKLSASVVYYIRWADRIKIGTTTNLPQRMKALYFDEIIAVEPGGASLEARRHEEFSEYRIDAYREWFTAAPGLVFFANTLRDRHGAPMNAWRQLAKRTAA